MAKAANFNGVVVTRTAQAIQLSNNLLVAILASPAYVLVQQKDQHEN